jgi:hypothetical protein
VRRFGNNDAILSEGITKINVVTRLDFRARRVVLDLPSKIGLARILQRR